MAVLVVLASAAASASAGAGPTPQVNDFCRAVLKVERAVGAIDDEKGPTRKQAQQLDKALSGVEDTAPIEVASQVSTIASLFRESARSGADPFANPELEANINVVDEYRYNNCGYEQLQVVGRDHAFEGIPKTIKSGTVAFQFTNQGAEIHELAIFRFRGDDKLQDLLKLEEAQARKKIVEVGGTFAVQGETTYAFVELNKPGRYGAGCFVPVGSTSEETANTAQGPPHAVEGMALEFRVRK
jgi:hypothetical protein